MSSYVALASVQQEEDTDDWRAEKASQLFEKDIWPGPGIVDVRNWHVGFDDASLGKRQSKHKIMLRHGQTSFQWIVVVDGVAIKRGANDINKRVFTIEFTVEGRNAVIECDGSATAMYEHKLTIDGCVYSDARDVVTEPMDEDIPASVQLINTRVDTDTSTSNGNKKFVVFQINVKTRGGKQTMVERRFSQVDVLDSSLRGGLRRHLISSLPEMPSKLVAPWVDQTSPEFVEQRRSQLEVYLNHLLGNSKLTHTTDLMCFLGLHPNTGVAYDPMSEATAALLSTYNSNNNRSND